MPPPDLGANGSLNIVNVVHIYIIMLLSILYALKINQFTMTTRKTHTRTLKQVAEIVRMRARAIRSSGKKKCYARAPSCRSRVLSVNVSNWKWTT